MMNLTDLHTHLLPRMDDGARHSDISRQMLDTMAEQNVARVVLTPHFYAEKESMDSFLERRDRAVRDLLTVYQEEKHPQLFLGAEVAYYPGLTDWDRLQNLCLVGTRYLLLEMPFCRWTPSVVDEVIRMPDSVGMYPIIAHYERYLHFQPRAAVQKLLQAGVYWQTNAEYLLSRKGRKDVSRNVRKGIVTLMGSDAHDMSLRSPKLAQAAALLTEEELRQMSDAAEDVVSHATPLSTLYPSHRESV